MSDIIKEYIEKLKVERVSIHHQIELYEQRLKEQKGMLDDLNILIARMEKPE